MFVHRSIPEKANRVLNVVILGLLLILVRVWYLTIIEHDHYVFQSRGHRRRVSIERAERATIRDRFNIPLAANKLQYAVSVCYADIRQIPRLRWEKGPEGSLQPKYIRRLYIEQLSQLLSKELGLDPQFIEDTIHGKASQFPHTPFLLKQGISEELYYRIKMLEKEWVGIRTERASVRHYPKGKVACDVLGYLGAINRREYCAVAEELTLLQDYIAQRESGEFPVLPCGFSNPLEVRERLKQLQEKAYTIHDLVGKAGIEGSFDEQLRGYWGRKIEEIDPKGNVLSKLPGSTPAISGQRVILSLSAELQEFAEHLLIENEEIRQRNSSSFDHRWIKGGSIVVLDPNSGEVLTLASYPRFDPNDFISAAEPFARKNRQQEAMRWLENDSYIGAVWEGRRPLLRERLHLRDQTPYEEELFLSWERYLGAVLPSHSPVYECLQKHIQNVGKAHLLLTNPDLQAPALQWISNDADRWLALDLCRLLVDTERFSPDLLNEVGNQTLSDYYAFSQAVLSLEKELLPQVRQWFHSLAFQTWRTQHFREFLKAKRAEEKRTRHYARPYTDYLEEAETAFFSQFWKNHRWDFLLYVLFQEPAETSSLSPYLERLEQFTTTQDLQALQTHLQPLSIPLRYAYLESVRGFEELTRPLLGRYRQGRKLEKHLAAAFYPSGGFGFGRSFAFRQATAQGSVFKLVVAYQALLERYQKLHASLVDLNPLTLVDSLQFAHAGQARQILGYSTKGEPIFRVHNGGKLPRSHPNIGEIGLVGALEQSSNLYFSLLAAEHIQTPQHLLTASALLGFGSKTGIELPGEITGSLPNDLLHNLTGLYSFAIGQHSLVVTPLQTSLMLAAIANRGEVLKPKVVRMIAGHEPSYTYQNPFDSSPSRFAAAYHCIGLSFPLFTAIEEDKNPPLVWHAGKEIQHQIELPQEVRSYLVEGMHKALTGSKGTARPNIIRLLQQNPSLRQDFLDLYEQQLIGKTGTAEVLFKPTIDHASKAIIQNHIWFGGISFPPSDAGKWENPELVIVVYLRFSEAGGKEAAPLAAAIVKKWREICSKRNLCAS